MTEREINFMDTSGGFTGLSGVYHKYRPGYPDVCFDALLRESGLNAGDTAADIGSGTGLFTRGLLARGLRVFAVEPNADMRRTSDEALSSYPGFVSVAAPAEHTELPSGSVKLVTAAQSFHWFDAAAFAAECRRILTPDGHAALIWNSRDISHPMIRENEEICRQYCPAFAGFFRRN